MMKNKSIRKIDKVVKYKGFKTLSNFLMEYHKIWDPVA